MGLARQTLLARRHLPPNSSSSFTTIRRCSASGGNANSKSRSVSDFTLCRSLKVQGTVTAGSPHERSSAAVEMIITRINVYLELHNLDKVPGPDGTLRFLPALVRIPDVSFVSWQRWPQQSPPRRRIPAIIPHLIIEVLSDGNTNDETAPKLRVYQQAGVRMIWYINPKSCDGVCHRSAGKSTYMARDGVLDGEDVLPDFQLSVSELVARADQQRPPEE